MGESWLVFAAIAKGVEQNVLRARTVVEVFSATVSVHATVGIIQFLNRGPLGFSQLGEGGFSGVEQAVLGPLGTFLVGGHVSGFASPFGLSVLAVMLGPIALALALRAGRRKRLAWFGAFLLSALVTPMTGSDTARGALIVGVVALGIGLAVRRIRADSRSSSLLSDGNHSGNWLSGTVSVFIGGLFLFFPTGGSGKPSKLSGQPNGGASVTEPSTGASSTTPSGISAEGGIPVDIQNISVPLFDLSNLGIRLQQYVIGIDLFSRYPLFGIGGANFTYVAGDTLLWLPEVRNHRIHNLYIELLAETGLPGFIFYLGAVTYAVLGAIQLALSDDTLLYLGVGAGLVGFLGAAFFGAVLDVTNYQLPFWILCGVVVGEWHRRDGGRPWR
jgi:O-antigen ligase